MSILNFEPFYGKTDTSAEVAMKITSVVSHMRKDVLRAISKQDLTTEQVAVKLQKNYRGIQPRTSELRYLLLIEDSGKRRKNSYGNNEIVWKITPVGKSVIEALDYE